MRVDEEEGRENPGMISLKNGQDLVFPQLCTLLRTEGGERLILLWFQFWCPYNLGYGIRLWWQTVTFLPLERGTKKKIKTNIFDYRLHNAWKLQRQLKKWACASKRCWNNVLDGTSQTSKKCSNLVVLCCSITKQTK